MQRTISILSAVLLVLSMGACASSGDSGTAADTESADVPPPNRYCVRQLEARALPADIVAWSNQMEFATENDGKSYQGDVDLSDGTRHSYLCDVDSTGAVHRSGWLADFG